MIETWLIAWWVLCLALAWWPCCCESISIIEAGCDCDNCIESKAPAWMTVIIDGVSDKECTYCELVNGTYVVPQYLYTCCHWNSNFDQEICGGCSAPNQDDTGVYIHARNDLEWEGYYRLFGAYGYQCEDLDICNYYFENDYTGQLLDCMNANGEGEHLLTYSHAVSYEPPPNDYPCNVCDFSNATMEIYSGDTT